MTGSETVKEETYAAIWKGGRMETERLILDSIRESDKEDYFINISHDKKVLETFICWEILDCEGTAAKASRQRERCHNLAG